MSEQDIDEALSNLKAIKAGDDPRVEEQAPQQVESYDIECHDDVRRLFVEVVNVVQPEHPYLEDPYPAKYSDFEWSHCKSTSNTWARCGPRGKKTWSTTVAKFYDDISYFKRSSIERVLCVLVHEATHITEGRHSPGSIHNPRFWRTMADNARKLRENLDQLSTAGCVDVQKFEQKVVMDPNSSMTDRRTYTVKEQRDAVRQRLGAYHASLE